MNGFPLSELPIVYWERSQHSCTANSRENRIEDILDRIFLKLAFRRYKHELYLKKRARSRPRGILRLAKKIWKLILVEH